MSSEQRWNQLRAIRGDTRVVGVFGWPVEHSLSPAMHNAAFNALGLPYLYIPFPVRPEDIGPAIRSLNVLGVIGVNLTIPHKESVLPFLDSVTTEAKNVGAVNTVHCVDGKLLGDNTDGRGFIKPLEELGFESAGKRVLVLGAGGAARSVVFRLATEGAHVTITNRTRERAEKLAADVIKTGINSDSIAVVDAEDNPSLYEAARNSNLIVHTTRIGMYPENDAMPSIEIDALHSDMIVYDLIYNPIKTKLLKAAEMKGCRTISGVKMLVTQGAAAFERWTGIWPPVDIMETAVVQSLNG